MILLPISREALLSYWPQGGQGAEIGTAEGTFAAQILEAVRPTRLVLIDPWVHLDSAAFAHDAHNVPAAEQESRYERVLARFAAPRATGQVVVQRAFSTPAAQTFDDGSLDWVYLDANKDEAGVRWDLEQWAVKLQPDGWLLGHDYAHHQVGDHDGFGVVEAVDAFVRQGEFHFVALTNEAYPTYLLHRSAERGKQWIVETILPYVRGLVELLPYPGPAYTQGLLVRDKQLLRYPDEHFMHLTTFIT